MSDTSDQRSLRSLLRRRRSRQQGPTTRTILPPSGQQQSPKPTRPRGVAGDELRVRAFLRRLTGGDR